jgi:hypothetical protein
MGLRNSGLFALGLAGSLLWGAFGTAFSLPAESFSKGYDIPLSRTFAAECSPLPCVLSGGSDPVRVGALVKYEKPDGALKIGDVICNPSQPTPLDINKEELIKRSADDQDLRQLFDGTEKPREIAALIKALTDDIQWVASSIISESMVDVKQVRRALAAIPSECRKNAISNGYTTAIRSRKFGILSLIFRVTPGKNSEHLLDELKRLVRENFELAQHEGTVKVYSKQSRLFSVQNISVAGFLKTHPMLRQ